MNSKIKRWEWWVLYFIGVVIWIAQILLNLLVGPGEAANALIEIGLTLLLGFYFHIRGVSMNNPKTLLNLIGNFGGAEVTFEFYPGTLVTIWFTHRIVKAEQNPNKLSSKVVLVVAGANKLAGKMDGLGGETGGLIEGDIPSNRGGVHQSPIIQKPLNQDGVRVPSNRSSTQVPSKDRIDGSPNMDNVRWPTHSTKTETDFNIPMIKE